MTEFDTSCSFFRTWKLSPLVSKRLRIGLSLGKIRKVGFTPLITNQTKTLRINLAKKHRRLQYLHASSWPEE